MKWLVALRGDQSDLAALSYSLSNVELAITLHDDSYYLTSQDFGENDTPDEVFAKAKDLVQLITGASRLALDSTEPISIAGIYKERGDGVRDIFIFPESIAATSRVMAPTISLSRPDGTVEEYHPADPVREWVPLALRDEATAKVLRIFASDTGPKETGIIIA